MENSKRGKRNRKMKRDLKKKHLTRLLRDAIILKPGFNPKLIEVPPGRNRNWNKTVQQLGMGLDL